MARAHLTHAQVPRAQLPTLFVDRKPRVTAPRAITCLTGEACVARMGVHYDNLCQLQRAACLSRETIRSQPLQFCGKSVLKIVFILHKV